MTDADADAAWSDAENEPLARRANVAVFGTGEVTATQRKRVLAALAALPDSGFPVELRQG